MSRILISSLKYSLGRITYGTVDTPRLLLRTALPSISCYAAIRNVARVSAQIRYDTIDEKIYRLDQHVKRVGRSSAREIKDIVYEIKATRSLTPTQALMLIRSCGSLLVEEKPEYRNVLVQEIWKLINKLGVQLDISHYNALLRVYLENEYPFAPSEILLDIESKGMEPNRVTCQRLIARYCQLGDIPGATRILELMREKSMPVNEAVFNSLILGHSQANDMESAEGILTVMKDGCIEPSAVTYTTLICGFIKNGNIDKFNELLQLCEKSDVSPRESDYFDIIYALALNGYEEEVDKVLERIRKTPNYNHEAMNFVFKLLTANKCDIGFKILKSMTKFSRPDGSIVPIGNFFISQLVRTDQSTELILKYSRELMNENINPRALAIAMENCLRYCKEKSALELFRYAKEINMPIRNHYFWPLLINRGNQKDFDGMFNIISVMNDEFGIRLNLETIREYVVPFMIQNKVDIGKMLVDLRGCGVSIGAAVGSVVLHLLNSGRLQQAAEIVVNYPTSYSPKLLRPLLNTTFLQNKDIDSYVTILNDLSAYLYYYAINSENNEETVYSPPDHRDYIGGALEYVFKKLIEDRCIDIAGMLIKKLYECKVGISENRIESIKNIILDKVSPDLVQLLLKLSDQEFSIPERKNKSFRLSWDLMDETSLERVYETMKANGESTQFLKKHLFNVYYKNKNLEKVLQMKDELLAENIELTTGMKVHLIDVYVHHEKVEEAMEIYDSLCAVESDFVMNPFKTLHLVELLMKTGQYDRGFELLKKRVDQYEVRDKSGDVNLIYNNIAYKILNSLAEKGEVDRVREVLDLLLNAGMIEATNAIFSPLIKAHIRKDDYDAAVKEFENCVEKYKVTPYKHELLHHFIEKGNGDLLQKITDLTTQIHGESNALSDVMLAFSECGRLKEARKIIETPGVRLRRQRLVMVCQTYSKMGKVEHLRNLLKVTEDIPSVDQTLIYEHLLNIYDKENDVENALGLWTEMQEEDLQPTDQFLLQLAEVLERNNVTVPFIVPEEKKFQKTERGGRSSMVAGAQLRKFIITGDLDSALKLYENGKMSSMTNHEWSLFINSLLKQARYEEAKKLFQQNFKTNKKLVNLKTMKFLFQEAGKNGDLNFFKELDLSLNEHLKKRVSFNNKRAIAFVNAGRLEELVTELEQNFSKVTSKEELSNFEDIFPKILVMNVIDDYPQYASRVMELVDKCIAMDESITAMPNLLWMYYLIKKDYVEAERIWSKYLKNAKHVSFQYVLFRIKKNVDVDLVKTLISFCESNPNMNERSFGLLYSYLVTVLVRRNNVQEALEVFETSLKKVSMENFLSLSVHELKTACMDQQIEFPYNVPQRDIRDLGDGSGSESDSD